MTKEEKIKQFVKNCLCNYPIISWTVVRVDEDDDGEDFNVTVTNKTNNQTVTSMLRVGKYNTIYLWRDDEYYRTGLKDFLMDLFLMAFLDYSVCV